MIKILYFAWVREQVGKGEEQIALPENVTTVGHLLKWMRGRGDVFSETFNEASRICVAVNQEHANLDNVVRENDEVAFFPPVTGG